MVPNRTATPPCRGYVTTTPATERANLPCRVITRTLRYCPQAAILALILWCAPAIAQEFVIEMPIADAAKVQGAAERVPGLEADIAALRAEADALKEQVARYEKLAALDQAIIDKEQTLRGLAEQERDAYKTKAERIEKDGKSVGRWAKIKERAAEGGFLGFVIGTAVPGVGNVAGGIGGALVGGIVGAVESFTAP